MANIQRAYHRTVYFPALSVMHYAFKKNYRFNGYSCRFFNPHDNPWPPHPYLLMSAAHRYRDPIASDYEVDFNDSVILGDSGGFQLCNEQLTYSPDIVEKLFNWLEHNTNYAMNLDFPPYLKKFRGGVKKMTKQEELEYFDKNLQISRGHFEHFAKNTVGKTNYLNIIHGRNTNELERWYEQVKDFEFTGGWSIGSLSTVQDHDVYLILLVFFFLLEKGELDKPHYTAPFLHCLGFGKTRRLPFLMYLQRKINEMGYDWRISYDSSSATFASSYGHYTLYMKKNGKTHVKLNRSSLEEVDPRVPLPHTTPICEGWTFQDLLDFKNEMKNEEDKQTFRAEYYAFLAIHNLGKFLEFKESMENIVLCGSRQIHEEVFTEDELRAFDTIDEALNHDKPYQFFSQVENRYRFLRTDTERKKIETTSSTALF